MALVAVLTGATVWVLLLRPVTPLDFRVFYSAGLAVRHGVDPYPAPNAAAVWSGSAFVYPYPAAWLFTSLAALSVHAASLLWAILSVAAITAGVWLLVGARWGVLLAVLLASPTLDGLQMGSVNAVLFLGLAIAWRWRDRMWIMAPTIALLIALKLFLWPLGLWLLMSRRWPAALGAAAIGTAIGAVGFQAGPLGPVTYLRLLNQLGAHEVGRGSGLQGLLVTWGATPPAAEMIGVLGALALMYVIARRTDPAAPALYVAALAAALFASPVVWHHYYLLAAVPLLLLCRPSGAAGWYLLIGWASVAPHPSADVSLIVLTVVADGVLVLILLRLLVLHRHRIRPTGSYGRVAGVSAALLLGLLSSVPLAVVGGRGFVIGLSQAGLPVAATVALAVAAAAPTWRAGDRPC
ncbi:MAG: glycosyltransferase family 87 protein [Mycobacteriales bacterium]